VPENVSTLIKTSAAAEGKGNEEKLVVVRRNEGLEDVLRANGASRELARNIVAAFNMRRGQTPVQEGQRVRLLIADVNGPDAPPQIARVSIYTDDKLEATVAMADSGAFVQVERAPPSSARPAAVAKRKGKADDDDEEEEDSGGMRLYSSFYETALKNDLPRPVIDELVRVFANDVDFQRQVNPGDNFEVFFADGEEGEPRNEVLFAQITARNETFKYYRFQTPDDNVVDYYDENGRSTRKFLMRKPMEGGETRSGFGMRRHPILGYARMHTGVDWAGPIGLPIVAAGAGTIIKAGRESGYGNRIEIQHANGYITTYNHLSGYARGVSEGTRVRQGQLIGYLGMTGLATGPHLHYEVIINGNFVDPMRVKLARTRELDGRLIANFRRERDRIEGLIAKAPGATRVAQRAGN
jgi:murein DD-endopeptidase MepM/ murein hydrolase activator NlpD